MITTVAIYICLMMAGFFIGLLTKKRTRPDGLLNVDMRDEKKDYYDFVFLIPTSEIPKRKTLTIEVHTKG